MTDFRHMPSETDPVVSDGQVPWRRKWKPNYGSTFLRFLLFLAGVVAPALQLLLTVGARELFILGSPWQSGTAKVYASILLAGQASRVFYPFLIFAMTSCALVLLNPERFGRALWVRMGIYSGVVLGVHYVYVHGLVLFGAQEFLSWGTLVALLLLVAVFVLAPLLLGGVVWATWRVTRNWRKQVTWPVWIFAWGILGGMALTIATGKFTPDEITAAVIGAPVLYAVFGSPSFCLATYVFLSVRVARRYGERQMPLWLLFVIVSWFGVYFAAWRLALERMQVIYASLPPERPGGCYIATAAAGGHRWLVRGWPVRCADGGEVWISAQLAWLKLGELAIAATAPGVHRALRRVYDRWGPPMAARLRENAWLADAAYISLKPFEWSTRLVLWLLLGDLRPRVRRLYAEKVASSPRAIRVGGD